MTIALIVSVLFFFSVGQERQEERRVSVPVHADAQNRSAQHIQIWTGEA
jgi:hypothetical protein